MHIWAHNVCQTFKLSSTISLQFADRVLNTRMANEGNTPLYVYAVIIHAVLLTLPEVMSSNVTSSLLSTSQSSPGVLSTAPNQSSFKTDGKTSNSASISSSMTPYLTTSMRSSMTSSGLTTTVPLTSRISTSSLMMSSTNSSVALMTSSANTLKPSHSSVSTTTTKTPTKNNPKKEETHSHVESTEGKVVIWILLAICAACLVVLGAHLFLVLVSDKK